MALTGALCLSLFAVTGITNESLRACVARLLGEPYPTSRMTDDRTTSLTNIRTYLADRCSTARSSDKFKRTGHGTPATSASSLASSSTASVGGRGWVSTRRTTACFFQSNA